MPHHMQKRIRKELLANRCLLSVIYALLLTPCIVLANFTYGIVAWLILTVFVLLGIRLAKSVFCVIVLLFRREYYESHLWKKISLSALSLMVTLTLFEVFLEV